MSAYGINPVESGMMIGTNPPTEECGQTLRKSPGGENGVLQMQNKTDIETAYRIKINLRPAVSCSHRCEECRFCSFSGDEDGGKYVWCRHPHTLSLPDFFHIMEENMVCNLFEPCPGVQTIGFKYQQSEKSQKPFAENGESQALSSSCHDSAVAIGFKAGQSKDGGLGDEREVSPTLSHKPSALEPTLAQSQCDLSQMRYIVRRLTPTEAERLMGLPQEPIVEIGKMTVDEFIAHELIVGNIKADFDKGVILSCRTSHGERCEWRPLQGTSIRGYVTHKIVDGGQRRPCRAHRIIWIAAHGIPPDGMVVDHINNKKDDNRLCNLQLLTPEDNSHKAREDGLYLTGEDNHATKITETDKNEIRRLYSLGGWSYAKLAERFNISKARIAQLIREVGYTIPVGLEVTDELVAEFQRIHDTFGAIMAEYEHAKPPKPKTAAQVQKWLAKIADPDTCPDSPRYNGCGNAWATNQPRWILTRLLAKEGMSW